MAIEPPMPSSSALGTHEIRVKPSYQAAQKLRALKRELKVAVGDDIPSSSASNVASDVVVATSPGNSFPCRTLRRFGSEQAVETYLKDSTVERNARS